jgi:16S rRNA processing protein RimM
MTKKIVKIGKVTGSHGLHGILKILPLIDEIEIFYNLKFMLFGKREDISYSYEIEDIKTNKKFLLVKCKDLKDSDSAEKLKGHHVFAPKSLTEKFMDEGECYIDDFIGAGVFDIDGKKIGEVVDLEDNGGYEIFRIKLLDGKYYLISNNEVQVPNIDIKEKKIVIDVAGLVSEDL